MEKQNRLNLFVTYWFTSWVEWLENVVGESKRDDGVSSWHDHEKS